MSAPHPHLKHRDAGFTLLEFLAVLIIIAVTALVVLPRIAGSRTHAAFETAAGHIATALRSARATARMSGQDQVVVLDTNTNQYWSDSAPQPRELPGWISISDALPGRSSQGTARLMFRFRPDGSASRGAVALTSGKQRTVISVDWLTGTISRRQDL